MQIVGMVVVTMLASSASSASTSRVERQAGCEQYGNYPAYTGPCEVESRFSRSGYGIGKEVADGSTDCGAGRLNCLNQVPKYSNCVGYPALGT